MIPTESFQLPCVTTEQAEIESSDDLRQCRKRRNVTNSFGGDDGADWQERICIDENWTFHFMEGVKGIRPAPACINGYLTLR